MLLTVCLIHSIRLLNKKGLLKNEFLPRGKSNACTGNEGWYLKKKENIAKITN